MDKMAMKDWNERIEQAKFYIELSQRFGAETMMNHLGKMEIAEALELVSAMVALMAERSRQD